MPLWLWISIFAASLLFAALSSAVLAHRLDQLGAYLGFSAGLLGFVTAFAADSPEISSAVSAIAGGKHDLGTAVIFGSNIFNIAALLGLSAMAAGRIRCGREQLLLHASASIWVTAICALQLLLHLSPWGTGAALLVVFVPYILACSLGEAAIRSFSIPFSVAGWLHRAVSADDPSEAEVGAGSRTRISWPDLAAILPLLGAVVVASIGMVRSAAVIGAHFGLSDVTIGTLVLAPLTGIPNVIASLRLAMQNRGAAVVSEAFNSNTLNLIAGAYLPTLFVTALGISRAAVLSLVWLLVFTIAAGAVLLLQRGLTRISGAALLGVYAAYAVFVSLS